MKKFLIITMSVLALGVFSFNVNDVQPKQVADETNDGHPIQPPA